MRSDSASEFDAQDHSPTADPSVEITSDNAGINWREWLLPVTLFLATGFTTTVAGLLYSNSADAGFVGNITTAIASPAILIHGIPFSFTFLGILLAHELGHYFACKYYRIRCTPPFFIPIPISIAGTLGAFIRIKSPFQNKRALFDVGIAGPLAGFVFLLPALVVGIANSRVIAKASLQGGLSFGEPLLFRWVARWVLHYAPATNDMIAHPIAIAAWFGMLATSLNLFPIWQLDGGHIAYAVFGRNLQKKISVVGAVALMLLSVVTWQWPLPPYLIFGMILLLMGYRFRFYHPPTIIDDTDIGTGRRLLGILALVVLLVSFTPVPITLN